MKKLSTAIVIILAIVLVAAVAYAVVMSQEDHTDQNADDNQQNPPAQNKTVVAPVNSDNRSLTLSVKYPGQGVGGYNYATHQTYTFDLTIDSNGWAGKSNIMIFGERSDGGIDTGCLNVAVNGNNIQTAKNYVEPENVLSAIIKNVSLSNNSSQQLPVEVSFNRVGNFTITFQAFDEKGNPLSAPLRCSGLEVPENGNIEFKVVESTVTETDGKKYTKIKTDVTNQTNVRVTINAADFYLTNGSKTIAANELSSPNSQTLNFGGDAEGHNKMRIDLYFDYSGSLSGYWLEYKGAYAADKIPLG